MNLRSGAATSQLLVLLGLIALACGGRARGMSASPAAGVAANGGTNGDSDSGDSNGGVGGTTGDGASNGGTRTDGFEGPVPCDSPSQVFSGGIVTCQPGVMHRVSPETCPTPSGCRSDADCAPDELCLCDLVMNSCVKTVCHADAECGPGLLCMFGYPIGYVCQTADDECTTSCPPDAGTCIVEQEPDGTYRRACRVLGGSGGSGPL